MTVYVVTSFNYNDPFFWASITSTGPHTLDFSGLPAGWHAQMDSDQNNIDIWNGFSWYSIGESGDFTTSTTLSPGVSFEVFTGFVGTSGDDYREGSQGDDTMTGGAGADTLSGDDGVDTISGGTGADYLTGGQDADTIHGGDGDDTIRGDNMWFEATDHASGFSGSPTTLTVTNNADGPIELWWIDQTGTQIYYATLQPGDTSVQNTFTDHNWVLRDENGYYLELIEGGANQTVVYGDQPLGDTLHGDAGNDTIFGEFGDDWIDGGADNDTLDGGYGNDTLIGGTGGDTIFGGEGDDTIDGGDGADVIYGDSTKPANVTINTSNYTDTSSGYTVTAQNIVGGTLTAPSLANVSVFGGGLGANGSVAFVDSGTQSQIAYDTATGLSEALVVDFDAPISDLSFSFDLLPTQDFLETGHWAVYKDGVLVAEADFSEDAPGSRSGTVDVSGHGAFDQIVFTANIQSDLSAGSDFVITSITYTPAPTEAITGGNDVITGGAGDDVIHGEAGDDWIDGGADNDTIDGGAGNDTLIGGTGNDTIFGDSVIAADQMVNGDLSSGTGWTLTGAAGGIAGGRHLVDGDYGNSTLTYDTPLTDLQSGPSANGTGEVRFDLAWSDGNPASTSGYSILEMRIDGVVYARITTPNGDGASATVTYLNGASGSPASLSEGDAINGNGYTTLTVDLPVTVPDSGTLSFVTDTTNGTDDFSLDNVEVVTFAPVGGGADTIHGGEGDDQLVGDDLTATGPNLIVNGSFEDTTGMTPDFFGFRSTGSISGWTSADPGHAIHVHNDDRGGLPATDGANWLDLEGDAGQQLTISQDVAGVANGSAYILSFDLGDIADANDGTAQDNTLTVIWNGAVLATINPADGAMESYEFVVIGGSGDGTDRLTFVSGGNDDHQGVSLDNVSLQLATSTLGGDDTFVMEDGFGNDTVIGGELGETGGDTIDLSAVTSGLTVTYTGDEAGTITNGTHTITYSEIENLILSDQADVVDASADTAGVNIDAGAGNDTLLGGTGDDRITGGSGSDTYVFVDGWGNDTIVGDGDMSTDIADFTGVTGGITVTATGANTATATDGTSTAALEDVGTLYLGGGTSSVDVSLFTTAFHHILVDTGLPADVTIQGSQGYDYIGPYGTQFDYALTAYTGDGDDIVEAGALDDYVELGAGNDVIELLGGNDIVYGQDGNDWFRLVDNGNSYIEGGAGDDRVFDFGGIGNDTILGGAGNDILDAGGGDDTFVMEDGFGNDTVIGGENAETNGDTIDLSAVTAPLTVTYTGDEAGTITDGTHTITFSEIENLILTDQADVVLANADSAGVNIDAGGGDDTISGGAGNDTIFGGAGQDTIIGRAGDDVIHGGDARDIIDGGDGADIIHGDAGDDDLDGNAGDDVIYGGDGNDLIHVDEGEGNDIIFGGEGGETVGTADVLNINNLSVTNVTLTGNEAGTATFGGTTVTFSEIETVYLDTVVATDDTMDASVATTGIRFGGGAGNDTLIGGAGDDFLWGYTGDDMLLGGDGNDTLQGDIGNDTLMGGAGDDFLSAGAGDDTIYSGSGNDIVSGGDGADSAVVEHTDGVDTIDLGDGDASTDILNFYYLAPVGVDVTFTWGDSGTYAFLGGGGASGTFAGIEQVNLTQHDDIADASGAAGEVSIFGGEGDDILTGGAGSDRLEGGAGDDVIDGGGGPTGITVGDGATETGTNGENHFVWSGGASATSTIILDDGSGTPNDADAASDVIYVSDTGDNAMLTVEGFTYGQDKILVAEQWAGINVVQVVPGHNLVTLTYASGNAQVFDIYHDGTGMFLTSDVFAVHGADLLAGGDGDDTFLVSDGFGNDTVIGGELGETNGDTIDLSAVTAPLTVTYTGDEAGTITDGTDTITFSEIENLILSDQADVVDASADTAGVNIDAGAGDDDITGGSGADTINGGNGNDDIDAGAGDDTIIAGDGNDYIAQSDNYGNDTVDGGTGDDWLDFFWVSTHAVNVTFDDPTGGTVTGGGYTVNFDNIEDFGLTDQSDTLDASLTGSDMMIFGYHGDDTIVAGAGNDFISGGEGSDTLTGGTGNDTFFYSVGDGADTITDFNAGTTGTLGDGDSTNNDFIDLSPFYDSLWELWADQADDGALNQSNATDLSGNTVDYSDNTQFAPGDSLTFTGATADNAFFSVENTGVACFAAGTLIATPAGPRPVESLEPGALVCVQGGAPLPVMWAGHSKIGSARLARQPRLRPVRIRAGALGNNRDLVVSPQHRIALGDGPGEEGFVPARWLAEDANGPFRVARGRKQVTYVHILLPRHAVIFAEGIATESFYPGPHALAGLDPVTRESLFLVYPGFAGIRSRDDAERIYGPLALPRIARKELPERLDARVRASEAEAEVVSATPRAASA